MLKPHLASSIGFATLLTFAGGTGHSQESQAQESQVPTQRLSLRDALAIATDTFAEVRATKAERSAAHEQVGLAKKAYLPDGDIYLQWNRATRNNVFGLLLPNGSVPSISGPALPNTASESTYGSVAAALIRWEALDFGVRAADVREAEALSRRAEMGLQVAELDVALGTLDAYLRLVAAESAVRAAASTAQRMEVFEMSVSVLAENELRPGADLSLARAEAARARTELIRAELARDEWRTRLSEWLGRAGSRVDVDGDELLGIAPDLDPRATLDEPSEPPNEPSDPISHPFVARVQAEVEAAKARKDAAAKSSLPKIDLLASIYTRGTGALLDGAFQDGSSGLWPDTSNWAFGVAVRFPFLDIPQSEQEKAIEGYRERAAEARYENAVQHFTAELERARIRLDAARRIALNTPVELEAARSLQVLASARYDAGLTDVLEVAESERILRRAETEDAVARLDVWRARFALAAAKGDLTPVLSQLE
jgi:outer membrane protein